MLVRMTARLPVAAEHCPGNGGALPYNRNNTGMSTARNFNAV